MEVQFNDSSDHSHKTKCAHLKIATFCLKHGCDVTTAESKFYVDLFIAMCLMEGEGCFFFVGFLHTAVIGFK